MKKFYVYKITNNINGKIYIGKSINPSERWEKHKYAAATCNKEFGYGYFQNAIRSYGEENFSLEIIEKCNSENIAFEKEIFWIEHYKTNINKYGKKYGYNLTDGGEGASGRIQSQEEKNKRANSIRGKYKGKNSKLYGRKLTDEHKNNISKGNIGKRHSEETKERLSKDRIGAGNPMYEKPHSKETKIKEQLAQSNKKGIIHTSEFLLTNSIRSKNSSNSAPIAIEIKKQIIKLFEDCVYTKKQLSKIFNIKYNTIIHIIRNKEKFLNFTEITKIDDILITNVIKCKNNKMSYKEISEYLSISYSTVHQAIKKYNLKNNTQKYPFKKVLIIDKIDELIKSEIVNSYDNNIMTRKQLAKKFELKLHIIQKIIRTTKKKTP